MSPKKSKGLETKPTETWQLHSWLIYFHVIGSNKPKVNQQHGCPIHLNQQREIQG
jgi:hypothetical protein